MSHIDSTVKEKLAALRSALTKAEIAANMATFRQRVAAGTLSPAIAGVVTIKHLNQVGDTEVMFPRVDLSQFDALSTDEQVAVAVAEEIIRTAQTARSLVLKTTPGTGLGTRVDAFDQALDADAIVIVNPYVGG